MQRIKNDEEVHRNKNDQRIKQENKQEMFEMMNRTEMTVNGDESENAEMRRTVELELDLVKIHDMTSGAYGAGIDLTILEDVWRRKPWKVLEPTHPLTAFHILGRGQERWQ